MPDPFSSYDVSLILAWVFGLSGFAAVLSVAAKLFDIAAKLLGKKGDVGADLISAWLMLCFFVISPVRYQLLQAVLAAAYACQSWGAFASCFALGMYVPVVYALLFFAGLGLPMLWLNYYFTALDSEEKSLRPIVAAVTFPIPCAVGHAVFFLLLPCATWTIDWISDKDLLRATNGPAHYFHQFIVEPDIPRFGFGYETTGDNAKERLRSHLREFYISRTKLVERHLTLTVRYIRYAHHYQETVSSPSEVARMKLLGLYEDALREAEQVDASVLDARFADLGTSFRRQVLPGLRNTVEGIRDHDTARYERGIDRVYKWGSWYQKHLDDIWR